MFLKQTGEKIYKAIHLGSILAQDALTLAILAPLLRCTARSRANNTFLLALIARSHANNACLLSLLAQSRANNTLW